MTISSNLSTISQVVRSLVAWLIVLFISCVPARVSAHPMPNSVVLLDIQPNGVAVELQLPLSELQLAFGHDVNQHPETLVARLGPLLREYLLLHVRPVSPENQLWTVNVRDMIVQPVEQSASGPYQELVAHLWLQPPAGAGSRTFTLHYDVIIHQLVTHTALVSIRQDWEAGVYEEHPIEVGVIGLDIRSNTILPLKIDQAGGSLWSGFRDMVTLGIQHIAEGTDHLLFLLVLLLPAPLLVARSRWGAFGGIRYSIIRLLKMTSAFTVGHSLTLFAGAMDWFRLPGQPVEILIAFSILVSAIHALRPIFPGREVYVAAGFGLVHGMAFAGTLANLNLDTGHMVLSILGFNIGIELMQLFVIALTVPWLLILSCTSLYTGVRITGALLAAVAALAWMAERFLERANPLTDLIEKSTQYASWTIALLASTALLGLWWEQSRRRVPPFL